jgi:exopolyphosphatase/pppGpp-phosphohydrolase
LGAEEEPLEQAMILVDQEEAEVLYLGVLSLFQEEKNLL